MRRTLMTDEELIQAILQEHKQKKFESGDYWCGACGFGLTTTFGCLPYRAAMAAVQAWEQGWIAARNWVAEGAWFDEQPENPYRP
jgi:hypothetical protein